MQVAERIRAAVRRFTESGRGDLTNLATRVG